MIAHRGYSAKYPENTIIAFEAAVGARSDAIETGIQVTSDGDLVLSHGSNLGTKHSPASASSCLLVTALRRKPQEVLWYRH